MSCCQALATCLSIETPSVSFVRMQRFHHAEDCVYEGRIYALLVWFSVLHAPYGEADCIPDVSVVIVRILRWRTLQSSKYDAVTALSTFPEAT